MEIQTNFQIVSDEELSEIVGDGYPNNQSMNDVLHWLNGHNDGILNNYLNGWVDWGELD
ncbi:lactococcin family bacteriocin [Lactococcus cremoris]|uniref:lactococcin family bacteriocin n=1 Tax=Lactococcus lactis subsp. cremoris TaxID=1359 RepID=UPI0024A6AD82|nr:lactococcin family bacteriocin [Lactococcus cremoris]